jgi:GT2 family glycosyltransferase
MSPLVLPRTERPVVSVLMVTYGGWELARKALEGLRDHTEVPYEVVIVDNASEDGTGRRLEAEVVGATLVLNDRNVGFGPAVNQAAALARARYLALLNPDALVRRGWLEPLIQALERDPGTGAAVARLVNLDGTVQEAGSLLWSDGSTLAFGAGADPSDPAFRFRRSTDYGSAACMLVRRADFLAVGGFDPDYLPAYCEDVDLALSLRRRGLRTVYEPRSEAVHVRFGSSDEGRAARLIQANREILRRRWPEDLRKRLPPADEDHPHRLVAARDAQAVDRILVAAGALAGPVLLELGAAYRRGRVTYVATGGPPDGPTMEELLDAGVEVAGSPDDLGRWFHLRLFHASAAVVLGTEAFGAVAGHLRRTQPQAPILYDLGTAPVPSLSEELRRTDVEAARAARVVLCRTEAQRRFAQEVAPDARVRVTTDVELPGVLLEELAGFGLVGELLPS